MINFSKFGFINNHNPIDVLVPIAVA